MASVSGSFRLLFACIDWLTSPSCSFASFPPPPLSPDPDLHRLPTSHTSFRLASTLLLSTLDSSCFILSRYYHLLSRIVYPFFTSFRLISYGSRFSFDYCRHVSSNFLPFKRYVQMKARNASFTRFYKMYKFPIAFYTRVDCNKPIENQIALFWILKRGDAYILRIRASIRGRYLPDLLRSVLVTSARKWERESIGRVEN